MISLERDFCDEIALLGGMVDEGYIFLLSHIDSYISLETDAV